MKRASVTEAKNNLSRLLDEVKHGATIVITERNQPVARLEPVNSVELSGAERVAALVRDGLAAAPRRRRAVRQFLSRQPAPLPAGASAVQALLSERFEGR